MTTAAMDWSGEEAAFFETPEPSSIDEGTTSAGPLWHATSSRWGHSMHTMCSYHGMFPAKVAHYFIQRYTKPGGLVLDPFSGRGTVTLQARADGRRTISNDLSPLAYMLSKAKANPPSWSAVNKFLDDLEHRYKRPKDSVIDAPDDIRMLYHPDTLPQIYYLRELLLSRDLREWSPEEAMIAGSLAGIMHGAHRRNGTSQYLSISMPNTFSMSPDYVRKYIDENGLEAPDQNVFECLRDKLARLYLDATDGDPGRMYAANAPELMSGTEIRPSSVDLIVTSPPYLQVVNYGTANWIRLWLLGVDEVGREQGAGRRNLDKVLDHRHSYKSYSEFMLRTFKGIHRVLKPNGVAAVVIGDVADPGKEPVLLAQKIWEQVGGKTNLELLEHIVDDLPVEKKVSRIWGPTKGQATSRDSVLLLAKKGAQAWEGPAVIDWDEPYKDGGPDAAHARLRSIGLA